MRGGIAHDWVLVGVLFGGKQPKRKCGTAITHLIAIYFHKNNSNKL